MFIHIAIALRRIYPRVDGQDSNRGLIPWGAMQASALLTKPNKLEFLLKICSKERNLYLTLMQVILVNETTRKKKKQIRTLADRQLTRIKVLNEHICTVHSERRINPPARCVELIHYKENGSEIRKW
jgi:hypothetical protein